MKKLEPANTLEKIPKNLCLVKTLSFQRIMYFQDRSPRAALHPFDASAGDSFLISTVTRRTATMQNAVMATNRQCAATKCIFFASQSYTQFAGALDEKSQALCPSVDL